MSKIREFYGKKFFIISIYKVGIEILRYLKYIHQLSYLYIDLKENNISCNPDTYRKKRTINFYMDFVKSLIKMKINLQKSMVIQVMHPLILWKEKQLVEKTIIAFCYFLRDLYCGELSWDNIYNNRYK